MKIEKNKEYQFYMMPDIKDITHPQKELKMLHKEHKDKIINKYFAFVMINDKMEILEYGYILQKYIKMLLLGFWGTDEGYFISDEPVDFYYAKPDKSNICVDEKRLKNDYLNDGYEIFKDVKYFEPIFIWDIKINYDITIKTNERQGFLDYSHIGIKEREPLYKDGDDQDLIKKLWDNQPSLDEYINDYKEKRKDILFDEDANKVYWENFHLKMEKF